MHNFPLKRPLLISGAIFIFCLMLLSARGAQQSLVAQEIDAGQTDDGTMTDSMRRFLEDQTPPLENLTPSAASPCIGGMADIYPCENVDLLAHVTLATMGATAGNTGWGWTDPNDGTEYAIMGLNNGTAFVDISDPVNPIYLGKLPTHTGSSSWREFKVAGNYVYIVSDNNGSHGMQVFDLTQLGSVVNPPVTFSETAHYAGETGHIVGSAHNIATNADTGYAYIVGGSTGCNGGLHMVNIQNPNVPTFAGCFSADGYTHDTQCVVYQGPDTEHQGDEICFNSNTDTLTIVDVTNKSLPVQLSRTGYAGSGYTHQGWLTEDQRYFLLDDELDESNSGHNTRTYMWDLLNLEAPVMMGYYQGPTAAIDHNLYINGNYAYESNYRAGLRILDISDVANETLTEVAYFDTYPGSNSAAFNGTWNNYPYFESGVVVISDIDRGLFLVRPNLAGFALSSEPSTLNVCQGEDALFTVTVTENGSTAPVTLTAVDVPVGASHAFSVNPVTPTGTSVFSVTNTAVVPVGSYSIDIVGSNITDTVTTTVNLDVSLGIPGAPILTAPADGAMNVSLTPAFSWNAVAGAASYLLELADDSNFSNIIYTTTTVTPDHTLPAEESLAEYSTYYWRVTASNSCGAGAASTEFSFTTEGLPGACGPGNSPVIHYETDLEDGAPGWTHSGTQDSWVLSGAQTTSGVNAWFATDFDSLSDQRLVSPAIVLPDVSESPLTLRFQNRQAFETPNGDGRCWDAGILEISTNGGSTWAQVPQSALLSDPYDNIIWNDTPGNNPITNDYGATLAWCDPGTPPTWVMSVVDLDAYAGSTAQFRWRLGTDSAAGNEGWYLDDVSVQSCVPSEYGVSVSPDMASVGSAGDTVVYQVAITNTGQLTDTFDLAASGATWTTTLSTAVVTLNPGDSSTFTVTVDIPAGALGNASDTATITATSQGDGSFSDSTNLTTSVEPIAGVQLAADLMALDGEPGVVVTYTVHVTNSGNITDGFVLSVSGNVWITEVDPLIATLGPGESTAVSVVVHVPAIAASGDSDVVTVTAVSNADPTVTESVALTTTAVVTTTLYLPVILKP